MGWVYVSFKGGKKWLLWRGYVVRKVEVVKGFFYLEVSEVLRGVI